MVSLITVNFNGADLTCALLESIRRNVSVPLEVIVVDNGSKNDEAAVISEKYPEVKAVRSEANLGFAGGNNLGVLHASGDYLFFLNNDTEILDDGLDNLVKAFDKDPSIGIVCPKIRFWQGSRPIQFAGYTEMSGIAIRNDLIGFGQEDDGRFDVPAYTPYAHGAAMMVSRKAFEDVGPMPECYFLYFEELDWALRFREKGWRIYYEPAFTIFHKESQSTGGDSPLKTYYMVRNRQLFIRRNRHGAQRVLATLYARYLSGGKRILSALLHGRRDLAAAVLRGNRDFCKMTRQGVC